MHRNETDLRPTIIECNRGSWHERRARINIIISRINKRTRRPQTIAIHAV